MRTAFSMLIAGVSAAMCMPATAHACTCSPEVFYKTAPVDGMSGVPLDFAPLIEGAFDPSSFSFEDEHGAMVEFALEHSPGVQCMPAWAELRPKNLLAPETNYTIRVAALHPAALSTAEPSGVLRFKTGGVLVPKRSLEVPQFERASVVRGAPDCGGVPTVMMCIGGLAEEEPHDLELIARRGDTILLRSTSLIRDDGTYGVPAVPDCIELRRRAGDGRRSEPKRICGQALSISEWPESVPESEWATCHDGVISQPTAGCAVAPATRGQTNFALLTTLGLYALTWTLRRARRAAGQRT